MISLRCFRYDDKTKRRTVKREDVTKTTAAKKRKVTGIWLLIFIIIQYIYNLLFLVDASDSEDEDDEEVKWVWAGDSKKGSQDVWVCPSPLLLLTIFVTSFTSLSFLCLHLYSITYIL